MVNKPTEIFYRAYQTAYKGAMTFLNWDEPYLLKGEGAVKKLPALVKSKGINNVLIVTDKGLMSLGLLNGMLEEMDKNEVKYVIYDGVQPNPTIYNIEDALKIYKENNCEGFIAFGGGSPMDCAKVTAARVVKPKQTPSQMRGVLKVLKKLGICI